MLHGICGQPSTFHNIRVFETTLHLEKYLSGFEAPCSCTHSQRKNNILGGTHH